MQSVVLFCFLLIQSAFAKNPFRVEISPVSTPSGVNSEIVVTFVIPKDHHMYRDMMSVTVRDPDGLTIGEASFPTGKFKPDPADPSQNREVFDKSIRVKVPVTGSKTGQYKPQFTVSYQGCKKSLCYMPVREKLTASVTIASAKKKKPKKNPIEMKVIDAPNGFVGIQIDMKNDWHINASPDFLSFHLPMDEKELTVGEVSFPEAEEYNDEITGMQRMEYSGTVQFQVPINGPDGTYEKMMAVQYQACKADLCKMPKYYYIDAVITIGNQ